MKKGTFWQTLPKPFTLLAPMEGVTDVVFREMITRLGKPDVLFTEFVACEGLTSKGKERVAEHLRFTKKQFPLVAQIWGTKPEKFYESAKYVASQGFSGIDINMGCPVRGVVKYGACSALINTPSLAADIIQATKEGSGDLPVSVKTRIGFHKEVIDTWIPFLLKQDIAALTIHLRTSSEQSKVPAHWEYMPRIREFRNTLAPHTLIIGNGDLVSMQDIEEKHARYKADGYMVGRGIFTNPWFFTHTVDIEKVSIEKRVRTYLEHIALFEQEWMGKKNPALLKKFCKTYIANFPDASLLRESLMSCNTTEQLKKVLSEYLETGSITCVPIQRI